MLDDVADCAEDADQARWLMMTGLDYVVETAFLWRRRWTPKGKRALAEVRALDPELANHCQAFLGGSDLAEQVAAFWRWPPMSSPLWAASCASRGRALQKRYHPSPKARDEHVSEQSGYEPKTVQIGTLFCQVRVLGQVSAFKLGL